MTLAETNLGSILGTVRYMSPEQACGAPVDKGTDIWSLGVVLYEMVTGHAPFTGDPPSQGYGAAGTPGEVMSAILEKEPPPLTRYVTHAPAELQQIVSKTLRKDPAQRYHSAHELLHALKVFVITWNSRLSWNAPRRLLYGCAGHPMLVRYAHCE